MASQFATLVIFIGYWGVDKFDFRLAPRRQDVNLMKEAMRTQELGNTTPEGTSTDKVE